MDLELVRDSKEKFVFSKLFLTFSMFIENYGSNRAVMLVYNIRNKLRLVSDSLSRLRTDDMLPTGI
jgi:hypothetical protein